MAKDIRTYIRVHDGMPDHPKVEPLSDEAFRLMVTTWCWCARQKTDGLVAAKVWPRRGSEDARAELIDAGLAVPLDDGSVQMHDYLDWQRSVAEIEEHRERSRINGQKGGRPPKKTQEKPNWVPKKNPTGNPTDNPNGTQMKTQTKPYTETDTYQLTTCAEDGAKKRTDPIWDALMASCGVNSTGITGSARGAYNRAAKDLRDIGATPAQITLRARKFRQQWPGVSLTPTALVRRWSELNGSTPDPGLRVVEQ